MAEKIDNLQIAPDEADRYSSSEIRKMLEESEITEPAPKGQVEEQADVEPEKKEEVPSKAAEEKTEEKKEASWYDSYPDEFKTLVEKKGFKSLEDATKAYVELEKKSTKDAQTHSQYREMFDPYVDFDTDGSVIGIKREFTQPQRKQEQAPPETQQDPLASWEARYGELEAVHGAAKANIILQAEIADAMLRKKLAPVAELQAESSIQRQKTRLRSLKKDFSELEPDIDKYLSRMDADSKMNSNAVLTLYKIVRGEKADELWEKRTAEHTQKAVETEKLKEEAQVEHPTKTPEEPNFDVEKASSDELRKHLKLKRIERY